jgi:regulator of nonsense transcripts 2
LILLPLLPQYVSEVVGALCEAPIKLKDVAAALQVCSALHQRYADFARELVGTLAKICTSTGGWAGRCVKYFV